MARRYSRKTTASSSRHSTEIRQLGVRFKNRLQEAGALLLIAASLYLLLSLLSYDTADPSWANTQSGQEVHNLGGVVGAWMTYTLYFLFGQASFLLPLLGGFIAVRIFMHLNNRMAVHVTQGIGYLLALTAFCGLLAMHFSPGEMPVAAGGRLGELVAQGFIAVFGPVGATLLILALFIGSIHLVTTLSWLKIMDATGAMVLQITESIAAYIRDFKEQRRNRKLQDIREASDSGQHKKKIISRHKQKAPRIEPQVSVLQTSARIKEEKQAPLFTDASSANALPPLGSLDRPGEQPKGLPEKTVAAMVKQLEVKLADFGVDAEVVSVQTGPVITRFELTLAPGTKANRITSLEKDLARALSVPSVRVVEVIPGKSTVGLEVPNETREAVFLSEILSSESYDKTNSPLTLALGKDISGLPMLIDLERMPHLLVAGTTGSGKSVAVHSMLMSILFKAPPQQVRLILIDPKMLELNTYDGIPHLLVPVITDMKHAASALSWVVAEMERRYRLMSSLAVRNIGGYNRKVVQAAQSGTPLIDPSQEQREGEVLETMPYIVVVVDEFADMMMIVGKRVEELIARLAQKARASGIHLLLATQRPSVDVITGLIKANIPARIAFQVSSKIDSRTILDQGGAEQLLGQGDMLYVSPGTSSPVRVHGAFVSDQEVSKVTDFLKKKSAPDYIDLEKESNSAAANGNLKGDEIDPLYEQAVAMVLETRKASISYVQRRFRIGYNRAARMIEDMEAAGIVSSVQANGVREVIGTPQS